MALHALRLRRALPPASSLLNHHRYLSHISSPTRPSSSLLQTLIPPPPSHSPVLQVLSRTFKTSSLLHSPRKSYDYEDEIGPDAIIFEGCDYNHWLITMDFPKDPAPTREEMIETYVQTLAKGLNISIEEAKKKMYACSTTTYQGFQAVMTEEESEKFEGLPGVVFVLPDSYIDIVNKEYGGDKYINGTIIPRPPPVQYGRSGGRYGDRNRNYDRPPRSDSGPRNDGPRPNYGQPLPNHRPTQQNYGPPQQNYGPPQQNRGPPQQNYGPPQQNHGLPQQNYGPPQQNYGPPQQNYGPPQQIHGPPQQNHGPPQQNYGPPQQNYGSPDQNLGPRQTYLGDEVGKGNFSAQGGGTSFGQQRDFRGESQNLAPPQGAIYGQGVGATPGQGLGVSYEQGAGNADGRGF